MDGRLRNICLPSPQSVAWRRGATVPVLSSYYFGNQGAADCLSVSPHPPRIPVIGNTCVALSTFILNEKLDRDHAVRKLKWKNIPRTIGWFFFPCMERGKVWPGHYDLEGVVPFALGDPSAHSEQVCYCLTFRHKHPSSHALVPAWSCLPNREGIWERFTAIYKRAPLRRKRFIKHDGRLAGMAY